MGEVWRARDSRLGREVAVKVLPDAFLTDTDRLGRFDREAHVLASLNHPNIAAIYGIEESNGVRFLVLELVAGETLGERLAAGPLPLAEALTIARQIAEALEAAHENGIVHRDLKPANIKITPAGKVKVLDFGLAKAFGPERPAQDLTQSPTASHEATRQGVILGTAAYMSPEQTRGKPVDKRADIWSFGCVLYEMLAGRKSFGGETASDTIAAILERNPRWEDLPASLPPKLRDLLHRCLQKDRDRRLHDIADARIEIEEILSEPLGAGGAAAAEALPARRVRVRTLAAIAIASLLVGALAMWLWLPRSGAANAPSLTRVARLTHDPGISEWPTWSPDGSLLAFASNHGGNFDVYVRRVEGGQEVKVTDDPAEDFQPSFSPDGNWIAFVSTRSSRTGLIKIGATFGFEFRTYGGDVWVTPSLGGQARRLATDGNFPAWHPDGRRIAYVSGPEDHRSILEVAAEGGTPRELLPSGSSNWEIIRLQYSPGRHWLSFETLDERVFLLPAAGGAPRELRSSSGLFRCGLNCVWEASGKRLYSLKRDPLGGTRLQTVEVNEASGTVLEEPRTVGLVTGILRDLAISRDGRQLAVSELEGSMNLTRLPLTPGGGAPAGPEEELSSGRVIDRYPDFSPDGKRIAYASDRLGPGEIWILDLESRRQERLQLPGDDVGASLPYWLPDGKRLVITRFFPDGTRSLWLASADGSHAEVLRSEALRLAGARVPPNGKEAVYAKPAGAFLQLFALDLATRKERQLTSSGSDKYEGAWSPDGRWIAFISNEGAAMQLWRMSASGGRAEQMTTGHERMRHPFYSPDGRFIYIQPSHRNIYRIPASGGPLEPVTRFPESGLFLEEPTLSRDGRSLAYCRSNGGSSLWLLTVGSAGAEKPEGE